jgi:hypothetical protein
MCGHRDEGGSLRWSSREEVRERRQDKGHVAQLVHLHDVLSGNRTASEPDPLDTMDTTLAALTAPQTVEMTS